MRSNLKSSAKFTCFVLLCAAAMLAAGCIGHNGLVMPWSQGSESRLEHVTTANFEERVLKSDKPVLVDFFAERCGPCKQLTPLLEEFSDEHPEVRVVKVDVDNDPELTKRYGVRAMPTLLVFRGGQITSRSVGLVPKAKIQEIAASGATEPADTTPSADKTL